MPSTVKCAICDGESYRHACDVCLSSLRRKLREIELFAAWLTTPTLLAPSRGTAGRRSPGYGSRPPVRLDAIVLTDPRPRIDPPEVDEASGVGMDNDDHAWPIVATLSTLAGYIREARQHPTPRRITLTAEVGYLLGQLDWAANQHGVAELADTIRRLHAQARTVARDRPPPPLGTCITVDCGGLVYPPPPRSDTARCNTCRRPYTGLDLVRLRTQQEAS